MTAPGAGSAEVESFVKDVARLHEILDDMGGKQSPTAQVLLQLLSSNGDLDDWLGTATGVDQNFVDFLFSVIERLRLSDAPLATELLASYALALTRRVGTPLQVATFTLQAARIDYRAGNSERAVVLAKLAGGSFKELAAQVDAGWRARAGLADSLRLQADIMRASNAHMASLIYQTATLIDSGAALPGS